MAKEMAYLESVREYRGELKVAVKTVKNMLVMQLDSILEALNEKTNEVEETIM